MATKNTSYSNLSGVGVLNYSKAKLVYSKRIKSNNYKYLCDSTRLIKEKRRGVEEAYCVYFGGNIILTIVPTGWYIERVASYDISLNNRLNTYTNANIFSDRGITYAGSSERMVRQGQFISYDEGEKYPLTWMGQKKYYRTPHSSGMWRRGGFRLENSIDLSDTDSNGSRRVIQLCRDAIKSYVHYYIRNFMTFKLAQVDDAEWNINDSEQHNKPLFELDRKATGYPSIINEHMSSVQWADVCAEYQSLVSTPAAPEGSDTHETGFQMLDYPNDRRSQSALQGLDALMGKTITSREDGFGVPSGIDLSRIATHKNYSSIKRWAWGSDNLHAHAKVLEEGNLITIDQARYEVIRLTSVSDLCSLIGFGSQIFGSSITRNRGSVAASALSNSNQHHVSNTDFYSHIQRHWCCHEALVKGFHYNDEDPGDEFSRFYAGLGNNGFLELTDDSIPNYQNFDQAQKIRRHNTCYPRSILLSIMNYCNVDTDYVTSLYNNKDSDSFVHYAETLMLDFFMSKFDAFIYPVMNNRVVEKLYANSQLSVDFFKTNTDRGYLRSSYWASRGDSCNYSQEIQKKVYEFHGWGSSDENYCIRNPEY